MSSVFLQDEIQQKKLPRSLPDPDGLEVSADLTEVAVQRTDHEHVRREKIAYERALKPLGADIMRNSKELCEMQAKHWQEQSHLQVKLQQAERRLDLLKRSGGNVAQARKEKVECLANIKGLKEKYEFLITKVKKRLTKKRQNLDSFKERIRQCEEELEVHRELESTRRSGTSRRLSMTQFEVLEEGVFRSPAFQPLTSSIPQPLSPLAARSPTRMSVAASASQPLSPFPGMTLNTKTVGTRFNVPPIRITKQTKGQSINHTREDSPTENLIAQLRNDERDILSKAKERTQMAVFLDLEGNGHLTDQLTNLGISSVQELSYQSPDDIRRLPIPARDKKSLNFAVTSARQKEQARDRTMEALLTSRAHPELFTHRLHEESIPNRKLRDRMEQAVRGRDRDKLQQLLRDKEGSLTLNMSDDDGWTLLHRACLPVMLKTARPVSPHRVISPTSKELSPALPPYASPRRQPENPPDDFSIRMFGTDGAAHVGLDTKSLGAKPKTPTMLVHQLRHDMKSPKEFEHNEEAEAAQETAKMVHFLIQAKADVDATNIYGRTPLHYAAMEGQFEACRLLVEAGADAGQVDHHSMTPVKHTLLMRKGDWDLVRQYLLKICPEEIDESLLKTKKQGGKSAKAASKKKK